jgi:hypothetical protein
LAAIFYPIASRRQLSLALLVLGVGTDYPNDPVPVDQFAVGADLFD